MRRVFAGTRHLLSLRRHKAQGYLKIRERIKTQYKL